LPSIDIDGRGKTPKEAVRDMWERILPLEGEGYHAVTSVEIVDTKSKKVVESFEVTDPEWASLRQEASKDKSNKNPRQEHKPPTAGEYPFKARVRMEL